MRDPASSFKFPNKSTYIKLPMPDERSVLGRYEFSDLGSLCYQVGLHSYSQKVIKIPIWLNAVSAKNLKTQDNNNKELKCLGSNVK